MKIVNQDRTEVINWDNVISIGIKGTEEENKRYMLIANITAEAGLILGTYNTLEEAKEMIEKISQTRVKKIYM